MRKINAEKLTSLFVIVLIACCVVVHAEESETKGDSACDRPGAFVLFPADSSGDSSPSSDDLAEALEMASGPEASEKSLGGPEGIPCLCWPELFSEIICENYCASNGLGYCQASFPVYGFDSTCDHWKTCWMLVINECYDNGVRTQFFFYIGTQNCESCKAEIEIDF